MLSLWCCFAIEKVFHCRKWSLLNRVKRITEIVKLTTIILLSTVESAVRDPTMIIIGIWWWNVVGSIPKNNGREVSYRIRLIYMYGFIGVRRIPLPVWKFSYLSLVGSMRFLIRFVPIYTYRLGQEKESCKYGRKLLFFWSSDPTRPAGVSLNGGRSRINSRNWRLRKSFLRDTVSPAMAESSNLKKSVRSSSVECTRVERGTEKCDFIYNLYFVLFNLVNFYYIQRHSVRE